MAETGYEFTADWFSDYRPTWDQLVAQWKPSRILEIGCYEGRATCYLIAACSAHHALELHCIDTWEGGTEHAEGAMAAVERRFDRNVDLARKNAAHPVKLKKYKEASNRALLRIAAAEDPSSFDLAYVDGSHQAPDVLTDAVLAFQLVRPGGLIIFDDYLWYMEQPGKQDAFNMPKPAIDAFVNIFQRKLRVEFGPPLYQLYVEKLSD